MRRPTRSAVAPRLLPCALAALAACGYQAERGERTERTEGATYEQQMAAGIRASAAGGVATGISTSEARFVRNLIGFQGPESVKYDPEQDAFFVTNMTGYGSAKDGNGYISRVSASDPDSASVFVQGGKNGALLDSPKGLAIQGDTLWVADITALRGFDRHSGAPVGTIDFTPLGAVQLNDIAVGPDGTLRVTDTGIIMGKDGVVHTGPDRIFMVGPGRAVSVVAAGVPIKRPNGITWDPVGKRWIVVSFDPFVGEVTALPASMASGETIRRGTGKLDGVEVLPGGTILFTSWNDSSIHALAGGRDRPIIREVPVPADIGIDTRRHRLAIPLSMLGRVQLWDVSGIEQSGAQRRP
jgi:sugar lactone lactonase YvrE